MAQIAADILSGIETFGIKAVGMDLKAAMVAVALLKYPPQPIIAGAGLTNQERQYEQERRLSSTS